MRISAKISSLFLLLVDLMLVTSVSVAADKQNKPQQQSSGIAWAQRAIAALTGGVTVNSVNESGSVVVTVGEGQQYGTLTLQSSGNTNSQLQITTGGENHSESRGWAADGSGPTGQWTDSDGQPHQMTQSNCWTDAAWFFPALSLLSDATDPSLVFNDLGQEQYNGSTVEHIQAYRLIAGAPGEVQQQIQLASTVDYYLDSQSAIPSAIEFSSYSSAGSPQAVPVSILFSQYQPVAGVLVPFQITRLLDGSSSVQITLTNATLNGQDSPGRR